MSGYAAEIVTAVAINAILAIGVYVTWASGQLSAAHPALAAVAGYTSGYLGVTYQWPFPVTAVCGVLMAGAFGVLLAIPTLRLKALYFAIATLAFSETMIVVVTNTEALGGAVGFGGVPLATTPSMAVAAAVVVLLLVLAMERSPLMLAMRAVKDDEEAAAAGGVNVASVRVVSFTLGAMVAGLSGVLYAHHIGVIGPVDFGFDRVVESLIFLFVGGATVVLGPVVGAGIFTVLPEYLRFVEDYRLLIFGALMTLVVIVRPTGLISRTAVFAVAGVVGSAVSRFRGPPGPDGGQPANAQLSSIDEAGGTKS